MARHPASGARFGVGLLLLALVGIVAIPAATATSAGADGPVRSVTDLATGWRFDRADVAGAAAPTFDDHKWQQVSLPHTWNAFDGEDGSANIHKTSYYRGVGWYRLHEPIPIASGADGSPLEWWLQFDGAALATDVYVNGVDVGHHDGGYTAFRFDITPYVTPGTTAVIAVRVNNKANVPIIPLTGDFTVFGGLTRMVHLVGVDAVHVTLADYGGPGVVLRPTVNGDGSGQVGLQTEIDNDRASDAPVTVTLAIVDATGATVAATTQSPTVPAGQTAVVDGSVAVAAPHLWDGVNDPYLYKAELTVSDPAGLLDEVDQNIGFRTFVVDPSTGAWLNGHPYQLHGVNVNDDLQDQGSALSDAEIDADVASVVQLGANAMRLGHAPHDERYTDDADADGLAVWDELPLVNSAASSDPNFAANAEQQLTEMIVQSENHPSVLVWALANELKTKIAGVDPTPLLVELNTLAHQLDPTRMTTQASCLSNICPAVTSATDEATDITGVNVYTGWFPGPKLSTLPKKLDTLHATVPQRALGMSEFGAGSSPDFHTDQPVPLQYTQEYAVTFDEAYLQAVAARPWLWCVFVWSFADHASDSRANGDAAGRGESGLVTFDRTVKKDPYYLFQSWWSSTPVVRLESSTWTDRTNPVTTITAISNATRVEAFLNGVSLGVVNADGTHLFHWPATLAVGANSVSVVANYADGSQHSDGAEWTLRTTPLTSALIDAGSTVPTVDSQGRTWSADTDVTGGTPAVYSGTVSNTADPAIAATYRIGQSYYDIPLDNGNYEVTVRLLEPKWTTKNKRLFSISSQGANAVFQVDLGALVGAGKEYDVTFPATVANHALALAFQAAKDQAVVSAIEVEPAP